MGNRAAERFVRNLKASIGQWKMPAETEALYIAKLSRWRLADDEWSAALSRIIAANVKAELVPLPEIYEHLRRHQQAVTSATSPLGHCMFDVNGVRKCARIYREGNTWMLMVVEKDPESRDWRMVRTGREFNPPEGASSVLYHMDDPQNSDPGDVERHPVEELVESITEEVPF